MAYGFETEAFRKLDAEIRELPSPMTRDRDQLRRVLELYIDAAAALLMLMERIMGARLQASPRGGRFEAFLPIYDGAVERLINELWEFLRDAYDRGDVEAMADLAQAIRRSAIASEMVALQVAVDASSGEGEDAEADESAGTTVTNSLKDQIDRYVKRKWIKDILHAINEVLSVVRGVA